MFRSLDILYHLTMYDIAKEFVFFIKKQAIIFVN